MTERAQWVDRPMRWSQLTLSERDAELIDVGFWLDYFARIDSDGGCLSAGGYCAYYPTDVPYHHRSRWLAGRDPFGDLVAGCRARDMVVLARTDPHAVHDDAATAHPEWIQRDASGKPKAHFTMPGAWLACMLGPYNFEVMTAIHREIVSRYDVQAIFTNRWKNIGVCYCAACQRAFFEASGHSLPAPDNTDAGLEAAYLGWQQDTYLRLVDVWGAAIKDANPNARIIPNAGLSRCPSPGTVDLDLSRLIEKVDILFADHQGRHGTESPLWSGMCAKTFTSVAGDRPVGAIFSVGVEGPHRWKDSVQSPAELRIWVAESVANGMRPWWTKFGATTPDERWLDVVAELYKDLSEWEPYLRNTTSLARTALVFSQRPGQYRIEEQCCAPFEDHLSGMYQALVEARIPFDMLPDRLICAPTLARYDAVVLANIATLSDTECDALTLYAEAGGGVLATHTTSLFDERGRRRDDLGLAGIFGVRVVGGLHGPMQNSYLALDRSAAGGLLAGLDRTTRVMNGVSRLEVEVTDASASLPLRLIASYPDLPMEEVYVRDAVPGAAQAILRRAGRGRVAYLPFDLDRTFWEVLHPDHGTLLANALAWVAGRRGVAEVQGPGMIDVTAWRQARSMTVHLVNLTNPMSMRGIFRELISVGPLTVRIEIPAGQALRRAKLLKAGVDLAPRLSNDIVELVVPEVLDHEIVAIDFV